MISYLKWTLLSLEFNTLTILTSGGVGYSVWINELTYAKLTRGAEVELYIHHHITEVGQSLFGFVDIEEKKVFETLLKISGIGGKVAQQILSIGIERLITAIQSEDNKTIESIKGIGKKMAEKIILELKDKDFWILLPKQNSHEHRLSPSLSHLIKESLTNMGYDSKEIDKRLAHLPKEFTLAKDIIPYMIRELS